MSDQTPTPRTAKAIQEYHQWAVRNLQATMRGSHLDSDDPKPPDGWATAIQLERELAAAIAERDEARAEAAELRERLEVEHKALQVAGAVIERLESEGDQLRERVERLREAMRLDQTWSVPDAIEKMCEAVRHLLDDHSCDTEGYEQFRTAQLTCEKAIPSIREALAETEPKGEA